jgi:AcrR family transcriptional regulator
MPAPSDKRARLIDAAEALFHQQGFEHSSIATVAKKAKVPVGNVFYYFKTKDELAKAVLDERVERIRERHAAFELEPDPRRRLHLFLERIYEAAESRAKYGCPSGGFCQEANKLGGEVQVMAGETLKLSAKFLERQWAALGHPPKAASQLALGLLASVQGAILLAQTFKDPQLLRDEIRRQQALIRDAAVPHA